MTWTPPATLDVSVPFDLEWSDRVLSIVVERWAEHAPDRECIEQDDGTTVTYRQLDQRASAIAQGLRHQGVEFGDRVATLVTNDLRAVYIGLAMAKIGAIEVPVNPMLVGASLEHLLSDSAPTAILVNPEHRERLTVALSSDASPVMIECSPDGSTGPSDGWTGPTVAAMLADEDVTLPTDANVLPSTPANIMYTSGTTGLPKGALLSHHHCHQILQRSAGAFGLAEGETLISVLPLFHAAGRYMNVGACLLAGARCGLVRQFSATSFFDQARAFDATVMHILVSIAHFLIAQEPSPDDTDHSITRGLIGPCPPSVGDEFKKRFGIEGWEAYASTESNISVFNLDGPKGACGRPYPPYRVRVVDENDHEVPAGVTGEIVVSCDEPWSTFTGYWNQPETTLETVRNFGMHTGDAGYFDDDGYLWFVNRIKDMIRRRGENVAAATVEEVVNTIDPVAESAAYPLPSEYGEDEIAVAVTLKPGTELTAAQVIEHCQRDLPRFAVPRYVRFMDDMPKTETGKLQKFKLKELGTEGAEDMGEQRR